MRVISIVSGKGGVGKTTLSSALAVRAAQDSPRVAMVDLDPMGSLAAWWHRRGETVNPCIFRGADTASDAVEALELDGWDWVFIDTAPAFLNLIEDAIQAADLALIPFKASAFDLLASEDIILMARTAGAKHLAVANDVDPRWKLNDRAMEYFREGNVPLAASMITHRQAYPAALTRGKSGPELERRGKGQDRSPSEIEIDALFDEVKQAVRKTKRGRQ